MKCIADICEHYYWTVNCVQGWLQNSCRGFFYCSLTPEGRENLFLRFFFLCILTSSAFPYANQTCVMWSMIMESELTVSSCCGSRLQEQVLTSTAGCGSGPPTAPAARPLPGQPDTSRGGRPVPGAEWGWGGCRRRSPGQSWRGADSPVPVLQPFWQTESALPSSILIAASPEKCTVILPPSSSCPQTLLEKKWKTGAAVQECEWRFWEPPGTSSLTQDSLWVFGSQSRRVQEGPSPHPASRQNGVAASRGPGKQRVSLMPKCVFVTGIQKLRIRVALKNKHIALSDVVL